MGEPGPGATRITRITGTTVKYGPHFTRRGGGLSVGENNGALAAIAGIDPAQLTAADRLALLDLLQAALSCDDAAAQLVQ